MTLLRRCGVAACCVVLAGGCWTGCRRDPAKLEARFLERGKKMLEAKDYTRAALEFNNAARVNAKRADTWYQMAVAYLGSGRTREAVSALRRALSIDPKHRDAQLRISELMVTTSDPSVLQDAVTRLDQVLASDANQPEALELLAIAELKLNKADDAVRHLEQALDKFPGRLRSSAALAAVQFSRRDYAAAESTLQKAAAAAPQSVEAALALAQLYALEKKPEQAEAELRRAIGVDGTSTAAWMALAGLQTAQGKMDEAEQSYQTVASFPKTDLSYVHAAFLLRRGKTDDAIREFQKLSAAAPDDRRARVRLIGAYVLTGKTAEAMGLLAEALKKNPKDTEALMLRSRIHLQQARPQEAEADIQQVLHFVPESPDAHYGLSRIYGTQGRQRMRAKELAEVVRLRPQLTAARVELAQTEIAAGRPADAIQTLDAAPSQQKNAAAIVGARNWALLALNRREEAAAAIDAALKSSATAELVLQRGILKEAKGDHAGARADAELVLKADARNAAALNLYLGACLVEKQNAMALGKLRSLVAMEPKTPATLTLAGAWLARLGKADEARAAFTAAKTASPSYTRADLGLAMLEAGQGNTAAAKAQLGGILSKAPQDQGVLLMLAGIEYAAKDYASALNHYRTVADLNADSVVALNATAYLLAPSKPEEALPYAEKALELAPASAMVKDTVGWVYYRKGLYTRALEYFKAAVAAEPSNVRQFHLAMCYLKAGDQARGSELLNAVLAKDPNLMKTEQGW